MKGVFARQKIYRFNTEMGKIFVTVFLAFSIFGIATVNADEHSASIDTFIDDLFDAHDEVFELYDEFTATEKDPAYWVLDGWSTKSLSMVDPVIGYFSPKGRGVKTIYEVVGVSYALKTVQQSRATRHRKDFDEFCWTLRLEKSVQQSSKSVTLLYTPYCERIWVRNYGEIGRLSGVKFYPNGRFDVLSFTKPLQQDIFEYNLYEGVGQRYMNTLFEHPLIPLPSLKSVKKNELVPIQTPSSLTISDGIVSDKPNNSDILDALYGVRSARRLYDIRILSTDGYWESDNIFVSKVVYEQSGSGFLGATSSQKYWLIQALIESGFSESEARAQMNILEMAGDFSNLMNDISSPFLSHFLVNISDEPMTLTEHIKFGRGREGWIPVVE